jgi:hypothetical protein
MKRFITIADVFLAGWCLFAQTAQANPCNYPKRSVNGYTVNLQPLMEWWSDPKGLRPLSGWKHVQGSVVRDTAFGWVVTGKADSKGHPSTFLIKNPPRARLRRFEELKRQLSECQRLHDAEMEILRRPVCTDWYSYSLTDWSAPPISLTEYRSATARCAELGHAIYTINVEMGTMRDKKGNFKLDAFALRLNESFEGLPVFDHGYPQTQS